MPAFPFPLQAQGAPLPAGLPGPVFCQMKGRRTANTTATLHCQCNSAPRLGSTRTWGPSGPEERQKHPCEQSRTWAPASLPAFTPHQTSRARRAPELRETRSTTLRDRNPQGCDSSSTNHKPCGARALLSGKISQLGVPPAPAAGSCWQTGSCQVQEGSTWLSRVGQTAPAWGQGHSTAMDMASVQVLPTPSTPGWECQTPGTNISLCWGSWNSPCPVGEVLPLSRTSGGAPSPRLPFFSSKDQPGPSWLWNPCSTAQPGFRAEDRGAQGRGAQGKRCPRCSRLAGTALSHGVC